jgi:hypothetical protein
MAHNIPPFASGYFPGICRPGKSRLAVGHSRGQRNNRRKQSLELENNKESNNPFYKGERSKSKVESEFKR